MALTAFAKQRRRAEISLGLLVVAVTVGGYILVALADGPTLPPDLFALLGAVFGLYLVAHLAVRRFAPNADATLLPLAAMLNGIGFVTIARLSREQARAQSVWIAIGIGVFVLTLIVIRDVRVFERYRYTALLLGLLFLLLPMAPVIGRTVNGGRLWVALGPVQFEPSEIAKVLLTAFFAAYLVEKRELLTQGRVRIGRWFVPSPRDLGPILLAWAVALVVLGAEKDMGTSLLFFGVFAAMLYMSTRRIAYVVGTLVLLGLGAYIAYKAFDHVQVRVTNWTDPWQDAQDKGYQSIQGWYALGSGGVSGTGLGLGNPTLIPSATTDFVFAAIGEELGLVGSVGVVAAFMLFIGSSYRIAVDAVRPFTKLFAAGIATIISLQTFLIIGGVLRVIPLTGITLPFISYGGSSLLANFALLALLLRMSNETALARASVRDPGRERSAESGMNTGIRRVGTLMLVLFVGLVAQLTYLQVARSDKLADDPGNSRNFLRDAQRDRGPIISAEGTILARSVPADDEYKHLREYPAETATLFSQVVGYQSILFGSAGVEAAYSAELAGRTFDLRTSNVADIFATRQPVGTVVLTMSNEIQQVARNALGNQLGSVVVLDVETGGVVAAYSNPTFDPNLLVTHDVKDAQGSRALMLLDDRNPLLARIWRELYPPGSTFKVATTSIAQQDNVDVDTIFPELRELDLPQTDATLKNFGDEECGGTMRDGFIVSCNTVFGQIGLDLGNRFASGIQRFGVEAEPPNSNKSGFDPLIVASRGPKEGTFELNQPTFAQAAIGQNAVNVTPLQMALVAQSVATRGTILVPHVVDCVKDPDGAVVSRVGAEEYKRAMDPAVADTLRDFMVGVVEDPRGTGSAARIPGVQVAGKTGTAQVGDEGAPHAWFIAFAPADAPKYAIAVIVEHGGDAGQNGEATGGRVAAPIAQQVLQAALAAPAAASPCGGGQPSNPTSGK